jgi:hypothetical protein
VQQSNARDRNPIQDIVVFDKWPGREGGERALLKVPSKISYSRTVKGERQWGYSIDEFSTILQWTKLELMPQSPTKELAVLQGLLGGLVLLKEFQKRNNLDNEIPKHLVKNASDVIQDYLYRIAREWHGYMTAEAAAALPNLDLDIVITHPVVRLPRRKAFKAFPCIQLIVIGVELRRHKCYHYSGKGSLPWRYIPKDTRLLHCIRTRSLCFVHCTGYDKEETRSYLPSKLCLTFLATMQSN